MHLWNLKYHFFSCQDGSSDYFTIYRGGRVGGGKGWKDAVLLTLIDNCIVFVVNVHTLFIVNGGFDINELKHWESHICFILCEIILSLNVLRKCHQVCCHLASLISNFCGSFTKISQPLGHFGTFIVNKEQLVLRISWKNWSIKCPDMHVQGTVMLCLYHHAFLMSSQFFKMFLFAKFGRVRIILQWDDMWFPLSL